MDRKILLYTHLMTGNTGIQLLVAHILKHHYGFDRVVLDLDKSKAENCYKFFDDTWSTLYPFLGSHTVPERFKQIMNGDLYMLGYYQDSVPLVSNRKMLLERIADDNTVISQGGYTLKDFLLSPSPIALDPSDIVMHIRLGDFSASGIVIDPAPQIAILRREVKGRLIIVCARPTTDAEANYLKLFEEFRPTLQHGTELEDFAVLRSASRLIVSNSTFSWFAAFLGQTIQRWIPRPSYNALGVIDETDYLYDAANGYNLAALAIPTEPFLPVTGEFLQSLCDYTILDRPKKEEFHRTIDFAHPVERQFFIEDSWPAAVLEAKSLFIYPTRDHVACRNVFSKSWPNLRVIVFHNSDFGVDYKGLFPFLETHPQVYVWAENLERWHPRIRPIPIGDENRMWRGGNADYEPLVTASRNTDRRMGTIAPFWTDTNPIRAVWHQQVSERGIGVMRKLEKNNYLMIIESARAIVCPPGNGFDTHRCWESIMKGAWPIVQDNAHTQMLLEQYPSLPLIPIEDMTCPIEIPEGLPLFHPVLLRDYWRTLFRSYLAQA